jgi:hypothetical protein
MNQLDYIHDLATFTALWGRARTGVQSLVNKPRDELLYFDPIDIATQKFFDLVQAVLVFTNTTDFATVILKPDPFNYFHHHFGKYPAFIIGPEHDEDDHYAFLHADPGGSPADALMYNAQRYAVLPTQGDWFIYGNWTRETGAVIGPPEVMEFARQHYLFFQERDQHFQIVD